jgi:hypothetical protein
MTVIHARPCSRVPAAAAQRAPWFLAAFRLVLYAGLVLAALFGGPVVRVAAICAIPLALLIDWEGGARHILRMGGVALAIWLAPRFGGRLGDLVSIHWGVSRMVANIAAIALVGVLIIATGGILARLAARRIRRHRVSGALDHVLGGVIGTAEAGLAVACVCWILAALAGPLASLQAHIAPAPVGAVTPVGVTRAGGNTVTSMPPTGVQPALPRTRAVVRPQTAADSQRLAHAQNPAAGAQQQIVAGAQQIQQRILKSLAQVNAAVRDDPVGRWLLRRNPLEHLTPVRTAGLVLDVAADPGALLSALDDGKLDAIAALPEVRKYTEAIENDRELRDALERQDFAAVLSHPLIKAMLADSQLRRALLDNVDELRRALAIDELTATGQ